MAVQFCGAQTGNSPLSSFDGCSQHNCPPIVACQCWVKSSYCCEEGWWSWGWVTLDWNTPAACAEWPLPAALDWTVRGSSSLISSGLPPEQTDIKALMHGATTNGILVSDQKNLCIHSYVGVPYLLLCQHWLGTSQPSTGNKLFSLTLSFCFCPSLCAVIRDVAPTLPIQTPTASHQGPFHLFRLLYPATFKVHSTCSDSYTQPPRSIPLVQTSIPSHSQGPFHLFRLLYPATSRVHSTCSKILTAIHIQGPFHLFKDSTPSHTQGPFHS